MDTDDLDWRTGFDEAGWIEPRLAPFGSGTVGSIIPAGFPAYARLLHPVTLGPMGERIVRWGRSRGGAASRWSGRRTSTTWRCPKPSRPSRRLDTGETTPEVSAGTLQAVLWMPTRLRAGRLRIECRRTVALGAVLGTVDH